eukprot:scaffold7364_cov130-Isochrysis_galbana.AAC.2
MRVGRAACSREVSAARPPSPPGRRGRRGLDLAPRCERAISIFLSQAGGMPCPASCCDGGDGCRECGTRGRARLRRPSLVSLPLQGPLHGVSSAVLVVCCSVSSVCSCVLSLICERHPPADYKIGPWLLRALEQAGAELLRCCGTGPIFFCSFNLPNLGTSAFEI